MRIPALLLAAVVPGSVLADPPRPGEDLFPLVVGNTWTYRVQTGLSQPFQEDRFVVRVVRKEMVGDQTCFLLEGKLKDRVAATEHLAFTSDGLARFRADNADITPPVTILKLPAAPKQTWKPEFRLGERTSTASFAQEAGFQGKRRAATIVTGEMGGENGNRVKSIAWYVAGVGMVRQHIEDGKRTTILEMEKFEKGE